MSDVPGCGSLVHARSWLIFYEDASRDVETFVGEGAEEAARARSEDVGQAWNHTLFSSGLDADEYSASLRVDLGRAHAALGGLQRDVERECAKSRPSKQRLREAIDRSDLARGILYA